MAESSQGSFCGFSRERVRSIYLDGLKWKSIESDNVPPRFGLLDQEGDQRHRIILTPEERIHQNKKRSTSYFDAVQDAEQHLLRLDETIASLVQCHHSGNLDDDAVVAQTCALLSRLPSTPYLPMGLSANITPRALNHIYFHESQANSMILDQNTWHRLLMTKWFDTNTIRLALTLVEKNIKFDGFASGVVQAYLDTVAEILQASFEFLRSCAEAADQQFWALAQSFLWTCWSRSLMLYFSDNLEIQLQAGFDHERNRFLEVRKPLPENATTQSSLDATPAYMCTWAFELLKSNRASILKDFRRFHKRFSTAHNLKSGRCVAGSSRPCNGQGPKHCQRFTGMKIIDQSAHDFGCVGNCKTLIWDEDSYRRVIGARAVSISSSNEKRIRYCQASHTTIAVSHVWAHGAGGRPHTGFNACLHNRLARLAQENSCDSYWMDTPCIPENHDLRAEAISNINKIFTMSSMTLIWDRDIMSIDISQASIKTYESVLCTLLVCDWNIRSWTLLESMRARHNIHLLCKDNKIISLRDCLLNVHRFGAIDIAILFLTNEYLLPALRAKPLDRNPAKSSLRVQDGYISVEESICLLAYRHVSRPGDSVVIMSLLHDISPAYTAETFWKAKIGSIINTGLLFSSQPRLRCKGFGWAPSQPEVLAVAIDADSPQQRQHLLFNGSNTNAAQITSGGLLATFASFEIPNLFRQKLDLFQQRRKKTETNRATQREFFRRVKMVPKALWSSSWSTSSSEQSANAAVIEASGISRRMAGMIREQFHLDEYHHALMLRPLSQHGSLAHPRAFRGRSNGTIFAVVGSNDLIRSSTKEKQAENQRRWHWLGLFEWDESVLWPKLRNEQQSIFLV